MGRKCSHCGNIGHNSRTCSGTFKTTKAATATANTATSFGINGGVKLFGVQLDITCPSASSLNLLKKSSSMDCLPSSSFFSSSPSSSSSLSSSRLHVDHEISNKSTIGYLSDGLIVQPQERKKGVPWTEGEHRTFLVGLEKLGKGDWRGISKKFVRTRTPTQVASHAQKYFLRQASFDKRRRRSSLFDLVESSKSNLPSTEIHPPHHHCNIRNVSLDSHHHNTRQQLVDLINPIERFHLSLPISSSSALDLELKLASPTMPTDENNSSKGSLLVGAISVI